MIMHNTLSLANASEILQHYGLLREMIQYCNAEDTNSANTKEKTVDSTPVSYTHLTLPTK